ncbi:FtsX-like permease family protein [Nocardioides sp. T2.26MG-1]|uniref:FtsX-like permease family protein n=1 Tax=Nocardioides sp. T2.26MG-1 TaxID=3041166 RepID=UPI0024779DE4|nr:FtsX-like permease family protein [Nocardioides sp. T2.26MG-1]CAI9417643.1 hypothetical protein HIDPHFAB_03071 [Nocardioides sp. T2.26MG-1]
MRPLAVTVVLAAGRGRAALVVVTTAATAALLLVAAAISRVDGSDSWNGPAQEPLLAPIRDPGTRPGAVLTVVLLTVPVLLLLDQAVRLGSTGQHRRYAALSVAGATRRDLRRWAAVEVGLPALAGALLGVPGWWLLREVLGHRLAEHGAALVPTTVGPGPWTLPVVLVVAAYGALVGRRRGSRATALVARGGQRSAPRPWSALLVLVGVGVLVVISGRGGSSSPLGLTWLISAVVLVTLGSVGLAPWAAHAAGAVAARRAQRAPTLLAARRLHANPRPAGRAAAAVGAVGLTTGVLGVFVADVVQSTSSYDRDDYLVPASVVGVCALLAVALIATSIAVHSVETTGEHRRETAALLATGVPVSALRAAQRTECLLTTLPLTLAGSVAGSLGYGWLVGASPVAYAGGLAALVLVALVVGVSVVAATALVRPWLDAAVDPANLRTE